MTGIENPRPPHQTHDGYVGLRAALIDADRVALDALDQCRGQLVVPVAEVEFLLRRVRKLTRGALLAVPPTEG